jgi:hypothetical protein
MSLADFKGIENNINTEVKKLNIDLFKKENKLVIGSIDQSTQVHFYNEIGLSPEAILKLPAEDIGNFLKQRTLLNLKAAYSDKPEEFMRLAATYSTTALATGASFVTTEATISLMQQSKLKEIPVMPSGDFINGIPEAIEKAYRDEIRKFQNYGLGE